MRKALVAAIGLAAIGIAPALAADLAARTYTKAPPLPPVNNWSGFYIGGMGGYGQEDASGPGTMSGGFGGGTLGYNWQMGSLVLGVETDAAGGDISASTGIAGLATGTAKIDALGTVRGRVGYAIDQVLLYGTGGFAWADTKLSVSTLGTTISDSNVLTGWTAGAGVEVMFAPKWSVKAEYLYRSLSGQTYFANVIPGGIPTGTLNVNSGQVGVNYHF
ncbi:outer membrane protein [Bradyrhizobium sp.]|uniref:outer membrane protein n=1 Tax=Bradyrhizobium sp. TaxID=376 RepID=UPI003C603348